MLQKSEEAYHLSQIASMYNYTGNKLKANECYERALTIYKETGNKMAQATIMNNKAALLHSIGQRDQALKMVESAEKLSQETGRKDLRYFLPYKFIL